MEGRHISIAVQRGASAAIDLARVMRRRLVLTGSGLRARSVAEKGAIAADLRDRAWPLIEAGKVRPVVDRVFPLAEAADAHRLMETGSHMGKIMLAV